MTSTEFRIQAAVRGGIKKPIKGGTPNQVLMDRKRLLFAALALIAGAAVLLAISNWRDRGRPGFVQARAGRFLIDGRPFRVVGANVAVMYRDEDRARMPETLKQAAQIGIKVVRVWA